MTDNKDAGQTIYGLHMSSPSVAATWVPLLLSRCTALEADNARLKADLRGYEQLVEILQDTHYEADEAVACQDIRIAELEAEVERLREALEPFARVAAMDPEGLNEIAGIVTTHLLSYHFRRAKKVLEETA